MMKFNSGELIEKKQELTYSYCIFSDLLGFSDDIKNNYIAGHSKEHLKKIRSALHDVKDILFRKQLPEWKIKIFTDNVVIQHIISKKYADNEGEFGTVILSMIFYQYTMLTHNFFVRGGWSVGELYMDNMIIYGISLIEAYEIESKTAKYPRIVFSDSMKKIIHAHLTYYAKDYSSPQEIHILKDENDLYFINYLAIILMDDFINLDALLKHKEIIEKKIFLHKNDSIREKYDWLAFYHNFFCDNLSFSDEEYDYSYNRDEFKILDFNKNDVWKINFIR